MHVTGPAIVTIVGAGGALGAAAIDFALIYAYLCVTSVRRFIARSYSMNPLNQNCPLFSMMIPSHWSPDCASECGCGVVPYERTSGWSS